MSTSSNIVLMNSSRLCSTPAAISGKQIAHSAGVARRHSWPFCRFTICPWLLQIGQVLVQRRDDRDVRTHPAHGVDRLKPEAKEVVEVDDVRVDVVDEAAEIASQSFQVAI